MKCFVIFIALQLFLCKPIFCGWIIVQEIDGGVDIEHVYIQNQMMKFVNALSTTIMDLEHQEIIIIHPAEKLFFKGKPDELNQSNTRNLDNTLKSQFDGLSENDKTTANAYLKSLKNEIHKKQSQASIRDSILIHIKPVDSRSKIAGYSVKKYEVWVGNQHRETLWIADQLNMEKHLNADKWIAFIQAMGGTDLQSVYLKSKPYTDLLRNGFPLKSIDSHGYTTEVIKIEEKTISGSVFNIPSTYQEVDIQEIMATESSP